MKNKIIKYLHNEISEEELRELKLWLKELKNQRKFKEIVRQQSLLNHAFAKVDTDLAYQKLMEQIKNEQEKNEKIDRFPSWLKYAAIFIGIIGLGYGLFNQNIFDPEKPEVPRITLELDNGSLKVVDEKEDGIVVKVREGISLKQELDKLVYSKTEKITDTVVSYNILNVPYGKQFEVVLTDGTQIVLNAGSKLRYPTFFLKDKNRNVYLEGEAFFMVSEDASRPFVVHTKKMKIRVLGTKFNVSSYKNDGKTIAVLAAGKIAATPANTEYNKEKAFILTPGQMASLKKGEIKISEVNVEKYTAWVSGKLMFINDPFEVITNKLERHYNVEIINHCSKLGRTTFTGTFESDELEKVLKTFQIHTPFTYKREDNKIIILSCEK